MKKIMLILLAVLGSAVFSDTSEIRNGGYFEGQYHTEEDTLKTKFPAMEVAVEYRKEVINNLEIGGGIAFQYQKRINGNDIDGFNSIPLYATARYAFFESGKFKSYVKADVGYSYNSGNFDDDIYYGTGLGVQYSKITWDIMYKRNNSSHNNSEYYKNKFDYDRLSLSSGFIFDF